MAKAGALAGSTLEHFSDPAQPMTENDLADRVRRARSAREAIHLAFARPPATPVERLEEQIASLQQEREQLRSRLAAYEQKEA